ncbi:MAG: hypothetical protein CML13_13290 [Puniceicoccaceae bacterium]|nr:hypothetical protein [Puniceicoccaceae bacterium]|tara:strand:- start:574 stop:3441 length:2868 start_codon:yes stop_codon:yes gene_type:complete
MSNHTNCSNQYPVVADVDVLVVGGTSQAVSFALAAKKQGKSVYLVAPRSYLGDDICAAYRFWPEDAGEHALSQKIFAQSTRPPTPMHVKLCLEQSLVEAEIPFLLNCYTGGLLVDAAQSVCGVVLANRSGQQVIRAGKTVDASLEGALLQQAGETKLHRLQGLVTVEYVSLHEQDEQDEQEEQDELSAGSDGVEVLPGYQWGDISLRAQRHRLQADFAEGTPADLARAYSEVVERCWRTSEFRHQTVLFPRLAVTSALPQVDELQRRSGLFALCERVQYKAGGEAVFQNPVTAMAFADAVAADICAVESTVVNGELDVSCQGAQPIESGQLHSLRDALRPGQAGIDALDLKSSELPVLGRYDVVVVGGGTGGAPAAISASRAGASTLVLELTSGLGGVGTMGQIAKYWCGNCVGFTAEIDAGVNALERSEYLRNRADSWSVAAKCEWYHRTGYELGCTYWFNTVCVGTLVESGRVVGLVVAGPYGFGLVEAGAVVDGTGSADIAAAAGAPTVVIGKEHVAVQGTGLAGVQPGTDYRNSDHNFSDDSDVVDATTFFVSSKLKFKDDFDCGELIDSRERRQIVGDYTLTAVDILYGRRFPDTVCVASSNFDSHGFTVDPVFMLIPPHKERMWADIPFGCLLPKGLDGVLVTGLGMSAHRDALPVIRMQGDVQNQGYVAGRIAAISALQGCAVREVAIGEVQQHLIEIGGLPERVLSDVDSFPVADEVLESSIANSWETLAGVSLILHSKERSLQPLRAAYSALSGERSAQSLRYAQILALLGDGAGEQELIEAIEGRDWDAGWRFQGMHQFGRNMSELDALLVCLGCGGSEAAWACLLNKVESLPVDAEFSHFRALAMGMEALYARCPQDGVAEKVVQLLQREDYRGHAQSDLADVQSALSEDINENQVRDRALRELHLARLLFHCGDADGIGRSILEAYTNDCRGHFARHARAVLS